MGDQTTSVRVRVRKEYLSFYKDLLKRKIFKEHNEFFTFCCTVGRDVPEIENKPSLVELCHAYTFSEYQKTVLKCLVYEKTKLILDGKDLFQQAEKLADAGFAYLAEKILKDFTLVNDEGEVSMNPGTEPDFQLTLSRFVSQRLTSTPF
jgi:ATP-dependent RNA circularization protein (DNA/RNA ligase family)